MATLPKRQSLSTIESSVTRLLVATKKLLESLTQWAKHAVTESDVSDSYVNLGNEFKVACRAFSNAGVDVSDLGDVPHTLRLVLEEALCEEPSQESLDKFLPMIREVIVGLLQNLKKKQATAKELQRQQMLLQSLLNVRSVSGPAAAPSSVVVTTPQGASASPHVSVGPMTPSSLTSAASLPQMRQQSADRTVSSPAVTVTAASSVASPVKPLPAPTKDALSQLQNGDSLRRRASKRFSAYQYLKLTNFTPERDAELPGKIENYSETRATSRSPMVNSLGVKGFDLEETRSISGASHDNTIETVDSLQVYLKIGPRVKKVSFSGSLTTASLRLLFVEKFAYSPGSESFPQLYIQDPNSNVSYELENLGDIQDQSVISLQEPDPNSVALKNLESKLSSVTSQLAAMQEAFTDFVKELPKVLAVETPPPPLVLMTPTTSASTNAGLQSSYLKELNDIKRDLAVVRQVSSKNRSAFKTSIEDILAKVAVFKETSYDASDSSNRSYMESCREKLSKDCEELLTKTDDLQDIIEAIRKDVAQRRARPNKKQLSFVSKELEQSKAQLEQVSEYVTVEKHNWKKIWEKELNTVCEEQQFFNLQEELIMDLQDDLDRAFETFQLVEECSEQFSRNPNLKVLPHLLAPGPGESIGNIRDALLSEVVALNPNHEGRVAAIEKAERLRQMQKEISMADQFQDELGGFVEGKKLKKSGGIEETERMRELQNRENLGFLD